MTRFPAAILPQVRTFAQDDRGATAIEYCLIACGIAAAIIATVAGLGTKLAGTWTNVSDLVRGM
jgi:pilus assembly protein Flp/PilA